MSSFLSKESSGTVQSGQGNYRYKVYRTRDGLTQPFLYSQDPVLGDKWIDKSEPEE
jgi:hypothetical protein